MKKDYNSKNLIKVIDQSFNINSDLEPKNLNQKIINTIDSNKQQQQLLQPLHPSLSSSSSSSSTAIKPSTQKHPRSTSPHPPINGSSLDRTSSNHSQNFESFLNQNTTKTENQKTNHHQIKLNEKGSQYNLDSRAERLKNVIERQNQQIHTIQTQISLLDQFCPTSAYSISRNSNQPTRINQSSSDSNHHMHSNRFSTSNSIDHLNCSTDHIPQHHSTITPKPRPSLPARVLLGYPLREPSPGHDPTIPKAIAPVGLNPSMEEIINCPQRGEQAHSISFLLNPAMNPAKENIRDLTPPPPPSSSNLSPLNSHRSNHITNPDSHHHRRPSDQSTLNTDRSQQANENSTAQGQTDNKSPGEGLSAPPLLLHRRTVPIPGSGFRNPNGRSPNEPLELRANDLIGTGRVTWNHAQAYWGLFFQKHSNRLTWCQADRDDMDGIRSVSDLLLASVLSVSAKVLGHHAILETCLNEAKTLTRCTMFPTRNHNYQDLKGIMTLAIYHGIHSICAHFVTLSLTLNLHKVFVKLTDPSLRGNTKEIELVEKGRLWLLVVIYSHLFCIFSNKMYLICSPRRVITDHAKLLRSSKCSNDSDKLIQAHVELVLVLARVQDKLDSRRYPGPLHERRAKYVAPEVFGLVKELDDWLTHWREETPELFIGLRSPHQYVYLYIMHAGVWPCQNGAVIVQDASRLHWAKEGCRYAEAILSTAINARLDPYLKSRGENGSEMQTLGINVEYHKVTLGLATGFILWISQLIPGYVDLQSYRNLIGRLHSIDFKSNCEYTDLIESCIERIDRDLKDTRKMIGEIDEDGLSELDRLMNDTRFWFMIDLDCEFFH